MALPRRKTFETDPRWLATADELSLGLIARAAPIRFDIAESLEAREAAYRLRHDVVVELGWWDPVDLQGEMEMDEYDGRAQHVVAWKGDVIAGTVRLISPEPELLLPVEEADGLIVEPRGQVVGAGRLIVARPYRERASPRVGGVGGEDLVAHARARISLGGRHGHRRHAGPLRTPRIRGRGPGDPTDLLG